MSLVVADTGDVIALKALLNNTAGTNAKLHLYTNSHAPAKGDTLSAYTESTAAGYTAVLLTGSLWGFATVSHVSTASYSAQTFTYTAAETVNGYYVSDASSSNLLWAEAFSSAFAIPSGGGSIQVTPTLVGN